MQSLETPLLEALGVSPGRRAAYGVLRVTGAVLQSSGPALAEAAPLLHAAIPGLMAGYAVGASQHPPVDEARGGALAGGLQATELPSAGLSGSATDAEAVALAAAGQDPVRDLLHTDPQLLPAYIESLEACIGAAGSGSTGGSRAERSLTVAATLQRVLADAALRVAVLDAQPQVSQLLGKLAAAIQGDASAAGVECARLRGQLISEASDIYGQAVGQ